MWQFSLRRLFLFTTYCCVVALAASVSWGFGVYAAVVTVTIGRRTYYTAAESPPTAPADVAVHWILCAFSAMLSETLLVAAGVFVAYAAGLGGFSVLMWLRPDCTPNFYVFPVSFACGVAAYLALHQLTMQPLLEAHRDRASRPGTRP